MGLISRIITGISNPNTVLNKLSIIIPVYNEEATINELLKKVVETQLPDLIQKEIIIIDDHSEDKTKEIVKEFIDRNNDDEIKFFSHDTNKGKGAAIQTGLEYATGDYTIVQDADLECDPKEYNILLEPVLKDNADVVIGSRFLGGRPRRLITFWHSLGNRYLTFFTNLVANLNMTDMECCFKLIRTDIFKKIKLKEKRFGFEPEVIIKLSRIPDIKIYEVGISFYARTQADGKKIKWRDGVRAFYCILKYSLFSK